MKLTKEQLQQMICLQQDMDMMVLKNNSIDVDAELTQEKYIALKTEFHEFINEIESFKYWKKNKGKEHILEEGIDTVHFILSMMINNEYDICEDLEITERQLEYVNSKSMNELYIMTDALMTDAYMMETWKDVLASILVGVMMMLHKCGFTGEDMFNEYKRKNQINIERQVRNY